MESTDFSVVDGVSKNWTGKLGDKSVKSEPIYNIFHRYKHEIGKKFHIAVSPHLKAIAAVLVKQTSHMYAKLHSTYDNARIILKF